MIRKDFEELRDEFEELVDLLNEILTIDTYEKTKENEELLEQKVAMFFYKMLKLSHKKY